MATETPILEMVHLSREVAGVRLVDDISSQVCQGEVMAVTGPSGSGKSSLLRLLNRLDEPTGGTVRLDGRDYREISPRALRLQVGMVMQFPYLFPGTVAANIAFGPRQRGADVDAGRVESLLERVHLHGFGPRDVADLSGGEAQRVSLARALANDPRVLLLDEPTSALDDASRGAVEEIIFDVVREHDLTCLIVTHDLEQVRRIADTALVLEGGRMKNCGPVDEVL